MKPGNRPIFMEWCQFLQKPSLLEDKRPVVGPLLWGRGHYYMELLLGEGGTKRCL
jgi:hypothetical protein